MEKCSAILIEASRLGFGRTGFGERSTLAQGSGPSHGTPYLFNRELGLISLHFNGEDIGSWYEVAPYWKHDEDHRATTGMCGATVLKKSSPKCVVDALVKDGNLYNHYSGIGVVLDVEEKFLTIWSDHLGIVVHFGEDLANKFDPLDPVNFKSQSCAESRFFAFHAIQITPVRSIRFHYLRFAQSAEVEIIDGFLVAKCQNNDHVILLDKDRSLMKTDAIEEGLLIRVAYYRIHSISGPIYVSAFITLEDYFDEHFEKLCTERRLDDDFRVKTSKSKNDRLSPAELKDLCQRVMSPWDVDGTDMQWYTSRCLFSASTAVSVYTTETESEEQRQQNHRIPAEDVQKEVVQQEEELTTEDVKQKAKEESPGDTTTSGTVVEDEEIEKAVVKDVTEAEVLQEPAVEVISEVSMEPTEKTEPMEFILDVSMNSMEKSELADENKEIDMESELSELESIPDVELELDEVEPENVNDVAGSTETTDAAAEPLVKDEKIKIFEDDKENAAPAPVTVAPKEVAVTTLSSPLHNSSLQEKEREQQENHEVYIQAKFIVFGHQTPKVMGRFFEQAMEDRDHALEHYLPPSTALPPRSSTNDRRNSPRGTTSAATTRPSLHASPLSSPGSLASQAISPSPRDSFSSPTGRSSQASPFQGQAVGMGGGIPRSLQLMKKTPTPPLPADAPPRPSPSPSPPVWTANSSSSSTPSKSYEKPERVVSSSSNVGGNFLKMRANRKPNESPFDYLAREMNSMDTPQTLGIRRVLNEIMRSKTALDIIKHYFPALSKVMTELYEHPERINVAEFKRFAVEIDSSGSAYFDRIAVENQVLRLLKTYSGELRRALSKAIPRLNEVDYY